MFSGAAAVFAEFFEHEFIRSISFVFLCDIVLPFADRADKSY